MTHVSTPQAGAFGRKRTRSFGPIVAAVAIVVAAGAAVATGIALSEPEATSIGTESIYGNLEALKYASPPAPAPNRADQVHRGRTPAIEGAAGVDTSTATGQQTPIDELVQEGRVPGGAIPAGTQPEPFYEAPGQPK